ncbi:MAG: Gfo/Idh/MocA family oxidoreductase [Planctomycetia bacterium]|nr:Gfo/Idh/MocA family oxidoreductase [Planctomycetia bacterium]
MKTYHVAILGGGMIGKVHAYAYETLSFYSAETPLKAKIKWVVNSRQQTADETAKMIPYAKGITDWRQAVEDPEIDIVHICTPNHLHFEPLAAAIQAGKHIYCEKPVVANWDEALKLRLLMENYHGVSHVTLNNRYFAATQLMKKIISDGHLGKIIEFRGKYMQDSNINPNKELRWRNFTHCGGGALMDIGIHLIDLAEWILGPIHCVAAISSRPFPHGDTDRAEDAISMLWRTESQAAGTLQASKIAFGSENDLKLEIFGTDGALRFDGMTPHHLEFCQAEFGLLANTEMKAWHKINVGNRYPLPDSDFPGAKHPVGWIRSHCACLADFLRAVTKNQISPMGVDLSRGIHLIKLLDCVRQAENHRNLLKQK